MTRNNIISYLLAAVLAVTFSACRDDFDAPGAESNAISFSIGSDAAVSRAAVDSTATTFVSIRQKYFTEIIEGDTLAFTLTESPNTDVPFTEEQSASRAKPIDNTENPITNFDVACYAHEGAATPKFYFKNTYTPDAGTVHTDYYWPANGSQLSFYASAAYTTATEVLNFAPSYTFNESTQLYEGSFDYDYLTNFITTTQDPKWNGAYYMPDLVTAITPTMARPATGVAPLNFHHALSAIVFKVGSAVEDVNVLDVYIDNVYSTGSCHYKYDATTGILFNWTPTVDSKANFVQSFHKQIAPGEQDIDLEDSGTGNTTFMLIPQVLPDDAQIRVVVEYPSYVGSYSYERRYTITRNLKSLIGELKADTKYTFTLGLNTFEVDVALTDEVAGAVKKNVQIQNTGLATGYVRAAICGWWKNNNNDVVLGWSDDILSRKGEQTSYGTFDWGADWAANWELCAEDGFYYYKSPLASKEFTKVPLFNTYTLTNVPGFNGATLELDIAVQIVHTGYVDQAKDGAGFGWSYTYN